MYRGSHFFQKFKTEKMTDNIHILSLQEGTTRVCVTYLEGDGQLGSASPRGILLSQDQLCLPDDPAGILRLQFPEFRASWLGKWVISVGRRWKHGWAMSVAWKMQTSRRRRKGDYLSAHHGDFLTFVFT